MLGALWRLPRPVRLLVGGFILIAVWAGINGAYHVAHKPTELFFPVDRALLKSPAETWRTYGPVFTEKATARISAELLAALAQAESAGNPVARTYWRWRAALHPLEWYQPASSAVGMYQLTDAVFEEAKRYCIRDHLVVEGPVCGNPQLYTRVLPSHAIELTAAWLDRRVVQVLAEQGHGRPTRQQQHDLAAVIHLCGPGGGTAYAARGFRWHNGQKCGDHDVNAYIARVKALKQEFSRLAANGSSST